MVSVRYLPTMPLELASPFGNGVDFELSSRRADLASRSPRARRPSRRTCSSVAGVLVDVRHAGRETVLPTVTSRAIAFVISVSLPVASAGAMSTSGLEKFAFTWQPRLHWPQ